MKFEKWFKDNVYNLERFSEYWEKKHQENPEMYPIQMNSGDWDEQFDLFCEQNPIKE